MVYYKSIKVTINLLGFTKKIINMILRYHNLPHIIIINWSLLFILKF